MNTKNLFLLLFILGYHFVSAQINNVSDPVLGKDIIRTGVLHSPLPLEYDKSFEAKGLKKEILNHSTLCDMKDINGWKHSGYGGISHANTPSLSGNGSLKMSYSTSTGKRAQGSPSDPDYASYGSSRVAYDIGGANWEGYNRIAFHIYPDCEGARVVSMNFSFESEASPSQQGASSASHLINLKNKEWNYCFFDIGDLQRHKVKGIRFSAGIKGKDRTTGDSAVYYIDKIELQQIKDPEISSGWLPGKDKIVYSTTGYMPNDAKTAIANLSSTIKDFRLINAHNGQTAYTGQIKREKTTIGEFSLLDFTSFNQAGEYRIQAGNIITDPFLIAENLWANSLWRTLNYIFCQRCGYAVPGIHSTCHTDLCAVHDGKTVSYGGGWHDAGDLSQQTLQTGDVTYALLEGYNKLKDKNPLLAARMLEEAEWGLEFILRTRFGDGYHASSVGLLIWQDGVFGTFDDIKTVRVQNCAFDNILYAAYEAYAAMTINRDPMLQEHLVKIAKEDFELGMKRHKEVGYGDFFHFYEHSYNTSESQYMATISWSASMLYKLTKDPYYAKIAAEYIQYTLECQLKEPLKDKNRTKGFFYRDKAKKAIVHYNHQSREQVYMQAMIALCETQPNHTDYAKWEESIRLYADYLKGLMPYTAPYGMIPSGVYHVNEWQDTFSFEHLHLFPPANAVDRYKTQVAKGVQLDKEHYMKRFPVWFSVFNGNTAIHLSTGKAAVLCGKFLKDEELLRIGKEQLYWTVGKNPFGQSLIYGEGYNYPQMDSFSSGEITGEMPVGIRSLNDEDIPYWPQTNTSCYKEVWVTSAGKWITLATEFE